MVGMLSQAVVKGPTVTNLQGLNGYSVGIIVNDDETVVTAFDANGNILDQLTDRTRHPSMDAIKNVIKETGICSIRAYVQIEGLLFARKYGYSRS